MFAAVARAGSSIRTNCAAACSSYSTVTGLTRKNWRTSGPAPSSLVSSSEDHHSAMKASNSIHVPSRRRASPNAPTPAHARAHRAAIKEAFPEGWAPPRKLSRAAMDGLRWLHAQDPETCTTPMLAQKFRISPEAVRRILRSKWEPSKEHREMLMQRERIRREQWIVEKREEETLTQERMMMERERGGRYKDGGLRSRGQQVEQENWSRNPRGNGRNDKLSLT